MMWTTGLLIAWLGCQGADLATTTLALRRGAAEQNVILRGSPVRLYGLKVGVNIGGLIGWTRAKSSTRRNLIAATFTAAGCAPAMINTQALRK